MQKLFFFLKLNKEYTLILRFIIITFIVIHLAGCLWYFVGSISDVWLGSKLGRKKLDH